MLEERSKDLIDIWKKVVEVQMHFNDICMRIRSIFVTVLLALFASVGFFLEKKIYIYVFKMKVEFAVIIPLFGIFGTWLFYFMDRYWYHRLLVGSVRHAIDLERRLKSSMPELSLSDAIGKESPYEPRGVTFVVSCVLVKHDKYIKSGQLHSDGKIELFYKTVMLALFGLALLLVVTGGVSASR